MKICVNKLNEKYEAIKTNIIKAKSKDKKKNERMESLNCLARLLKDKLKTHLNKAA